MRILKIFDRKLTASRFRYFLFLFFLFLISSLLPARQSFSQPEPEPANLAPIPTNIYVEEFFVHPDVRFKYDITEVKGFLFLNTPNRERDTQYSIVTDFKGGVLKSRFVPGMKSPEDLEKWVDENSEAASFEGADVRRLTFPASVDPETKQYYYWIGNKSFPTAEEARSQIALVKSLAEAQGGNFAQLVEEAKRYIRPTIEKPEAAEVKSPEQFEREERIALKWADKMHFGEKLFGPFHGTAPGETILWQSFGETTFRNTNLEEHGYNAQVGFWTNRIVLKGIRAPLATINPYVEATAAVESVGIDFKSNLKLYAGLEWRPLENNAWLYNYRPWGLPLLEWIRNYRFYVQYGNRKNIKDEILGSTDHDLHAGVQIFYEWGIDLPALTEGRPTTIPDFLRKYIWGEYFGNYRYEMTNFGSEDDYAAILLNSSMILGFRLPGIPLPENPINNELVLMPYLRFEHVNNTELSFPYQNYYFLGTGVRWMPFRNYRYKENEWLSKVKIFGEYVGIGQVQHAKQNGEAPNATRYDFRLGINISSRRF